jgi:hypothetical protein
VSVATTNPQPQLVGIDPAVIPQGSPDLTLSVLGVNFVDGSTVYVGGSPRTTTWLAPGRLSITLLAADSATSGQLAITVISPAPGGGTSNAVSLTVTPAALPGPAPQYTVYLPLVIK